MKPYTPRGKVVPLLNAVKASPDRIFSYEEAARLMGGIRPNSVTAMITYALRAGIIFRAKKTSKSSWLLKGSPFPEDLAAPVPQPIEGAAQRAARRGADQWTTSHDDILVPKVVPGWRPPVMVPVRSQA